MDSLSEKNAVDDVTVIDVSEGGEFSKRSAISEVAIFTTEGRSHLQLRPFLCDLCVLEQLTVGVSN